MRRRSVSRTMVRKYSRRRKRSGFEVMLEEWFREQDGWIITPQAPIGRCHVDFLIGQKLVVEAQGCYFHGCDKCQQPLSKRQLRRRSKDKYRFLFLTQAGYHVLPLWECEVKKRGKAWTVKKVRSQLCRSGPLSDPPSE